EAGAVQSYCASPTFHAGYLLPAMSHGCGRRCAPGGVGAPTAGRSTVGSEVEVVVTRVVIGVGIGLRRRAGLRLLPRLGLVAVALAAGHLGGGEPQGRSGLLDVQLEGDALVALL